MFDYLTGIYNITPTPFKPDGTLDEPSLRKLTEFTRGTRVNGMTILGVSRGDSDRTGARGVRISCRDRGATFPICFVTTHAAPTALAYSRRARAGRQGVMVARRSARSNDAASSATTWRWLTRSRSVVVPVPPSIAAHDERRGSRSSRRVAAPGIPAR